MMTRKHFIAIAKILKENKASHKMIKEFALLCLEENPLFDYTKFVNACNWGFPNGPD
jgi:hypothetical protein|tara:strand:- start:398 stop:568 length:171 start_codon:yes stop_codon:yes gene_type:complete